MSFDSVYCILFYISIFIIIIIVSINIFIISLSLYRVCLLSDLLSIYCIFTVLLHYDANKDYYRGVVQFRTSVTLTLTLTLT